MANPDDSDVKAQLRHMDEQLTAMLVLADEQQDFLLGALLCDVHAHIVRRYADLA